MAPATEDEVTKIASGFGYTIPEHQIDDYVQLLNRTKKQIETVLEFDDYQPVPDFEATPRNNVHFPKPEENPLSAWAWKCDTRHASPTSTLLQGKSLCLKDNIAMAGVPCLLGTNTFTDWTPKTDATVVTRILAAGGTIAGKAVCENLSRGPVSYSAATGPVSNPYAKGYNAGGSSSGTGALVGSGAVDMGLGCDQGGSIRIPAAMCGLYGLKATVGLVPYTGIASNDASVDYVGPITRTAMDCAVLLEAIAGVDELDDRQGPGCPFPKDVPKYAEGVRSVKAGAEGLKGVKIGVLKEGLTSPVLEEEVKSKFHDAVKEFEKLGATVVEISVPIHEKGITIYNVMSKMGNHMGMVGRATGRSQVLLTDLFEKKNFPYSSDVIHKMNTTSTEGMVSAEYAWTHHPTVYPRAVNLMRRVRDDYNKALEQVDFLVMPTTLTPSKPLPPPGSGPLVNATAAAGMIDNTCSFNGTGHPALAMPIGFVQCKQDAAVKVPASLQIVGKHWDEMGILKVAQAWEMANDWKKF